MHLTIKEKINHHAYFSGIDSLEECLDKTHFSNYSKFIEYNYNSRGFRDTEWPENLSKAVWCIGDSFTVGIGQPFEEIWPRLLQKKIGKRCINISQDGCSNDIICERVKEIKNICDPYIIVIMWSYVSRRINQGKNVQYKETDFGDTADTENFLKNWKTVDSLGMKIIHTVVPNAFFNDKMIYIINKETKNKILYFEQIDYARDYHHFDFRTSDKITDLIKEKIKSFDN